MRHGPSYAFNTGSGKRVEVISTDEVYGRAKLMREIFYGKPVEKEEELPFEWPRFVKYLGPNNSEIYHSDKMLGKGKWELYKHVCEGPQDLFINDAITRLLNDDGQPVEFREGSKKRALAGNSDIPRVFHTQTFEITEAMPKYFSVLAENIGVQFLTPDRRYWEVRLPDSTLAAACHPRTKEPFLFIYTAEGLHFLITGKILDISKHGIVG